MNATWTFVVEVAGSEELGDFVNNLGSDLAPLLALFGDRTTTQLLSQTMDSRDCIIMSMAPSGIITTMVCAIRAARGPAWLKALVGRAKENLTHAEQEVMSSTSAEVCELYNGNSIVRCVGPGPVEEFICLFRRVDGTAKAGSKNSPAVFMTVEEAVRERLLIPIKDTDREACDSSPQSQSVDDEVVATTTAYAPEQGDFHMKRRSIRQRVLPESLAPASQEPCIERGITSPEDSSGRDRGSASQAPLIVIASTTPDAPNISLNLQAQNDKRRTWIAVFSIMLQLCVLAFFFATVYAPGLKHLQKDGKPAPGYALPVAVIGTVLLNLGMYICARVVESSTQEQIYRTTEKFDMYLNWCQRGERVSDQVFESYGITPDRPRPYVYTSRRVQDEQLIRGLQRNATFGVGFGITGFVLTFVGVRAMSPAAGLAVLCAVGIMIVCRAIARPGYTKSFKANKLRQGSEVDWLAHEQFRQKRDRFGDPKDVEGAETKEPGAAPQPDTARVEPEPKDLESETVTGDKAQDCSFTSWSIVTDANEVRHGPFEPLTEDMERQPLHSGAQDLLMIRQGLGRLSKAPGSLSRCVENIANAMEASLDILFHQGPGRQTSKGFRWFLNVAVGGSRPGKGVIQKAYLDMHFKDGNWQVEALEIHAVLSLWIHTTRVREDKAQRPDGKEAARHVADMLYAKDVPEPSLKALGSGNHSLQDQVIADLEAWTTQDYEALMAIRGAWDAEEEKRSTSDGKDSGNLPAKQTKQAKQARTSTLNARRKLWSIFSAPGSQTVESSQVMEAIYGTDLLFSFMWSMAETHPGRLRGKVEMKLNLPSSEGRYVEHLRHKGVTALVNAFRTASCWSESETCLGVLSPLSIMGKLPMPELLFETLSRGVMQGRKEGSMSSYCDALRKACGRVERLIEDRTSGIGHSGVTWLLEQSRALQELRMIPSQWSPKDFGLLLAMERDIRSMIRRNVAEFMPQNFLRHVAQLFTRQGKGIHLGFVQTSLPELELPGRARITPLHTRAMSKYEDRELAVEDEAFVNYEDVCRWTPLMYAAVNGKAGLVQRLIELGADATLTDFRGRTIAHLASLAGHHETLETLDKMGVALDVQASDGAWPMHLAAGKGHVEIVRFFLEMARGGPQDPPKLQGL